ncbi:MAG: spermidine/putrescine ABC transporter substrate-binding protein [Anaerolineales bacterium]|nr:spermidine/putrescine ABC transporter substrate-binding protein [Anaerolineales bacterium]
MMKKYRIATLFILVALLLVACGGQKASNVLNLYAWSEYVPQGLLDDFTAQTGIKVNYDTYSSNEELLAKLQAGASGYDVIIPSDYTVAIMIKQGMLEELDHSKIPNFVNIDNRFTNPDFDPGDKYTVPYQWGTTGLMYDKTKVPFEPTHWADLWDPAFANRLVALDDGREIIGVVLQTLGYDKNTVDQAQLEEAKQKLLELKPNIRLFDSDSPHTALLNGEAWAGITWNGDAALAFRENPDIVYICPQEGCGIWFDNLAIPKNAPHKDAALAFINYVLSPKASVMITEEFPYSSPNTAGLEYLKTYDAALYQSYMDFSGTNPSDDFLAHATPIRDVGDATTLYDRIWTEIKGEE